MAAEKSGSSREITKTKAATQESPTSVPPPGPVSEPSAGPPAQPTVSVDDSTAMACYANFCRVSSTPEELILDLGLNPNSMQAGDVCIKVSQRIVLNHYTAKRLLGALSTALQRHEQIFGVLEIDVRRRVHAP